MLRPLVAWVNGLVYKFATVLGDAGQKSLMVTAWFHLGLRKLVIGVVWLAMADKLASFVS